MELQLETEESRFQRQQLITWWDQDILRNARVLVAGAGALGNEILKNLALLGVGNIFVADLDMIALSNLSRTVLFRENDLGRSKAEVAAQAVRSIYPEAAIRAFTGDVIYELGLGVFHWAQIVIRAGLDNREARLAINRNCWKMGVPWIDSGAHRGGFEKAWSESSSPRTGPCYECTLGAVDWKILAARRSCALLTRAEMEAGKVPTTATTSSIIAGLECHEAVKWLHGRSDFRGRGIAFHGITNEFSPVLYQRRETCFGHVTFPKPIALGAGAGEMTLGELLERAQSQVGAGASVELNRDILRSLECPRCKNVQEIFRPLGTVTEKEAKCPACRLPRIVQLLQQIDGDCGLLDRTAAQIGVPPFDVLLARNGDHEVSFWFDGDADAVLGELTHGRD